jgi:DNA-binding protein HU-beta
MNKEQLVGKVAARTGLTKKDVLEVLNVSLEMITTSLKRREKVTLVGFGTFVIRNRAARPGRNPYTGARLQIPAKRVPAFAAGKELKAAVK